MRKQPDTRQPTSVAADPGQQGSERAAMGFLDMFVKELIKVEVKGA